MPREPQTEMQTIAGYRVPIYLVESYARATATCGAYKEHQAVFDYMTLHYKLFRKYWIFAQDGKGHMHLEIAQSILDGTFDHLKEYEPIAKFAVGLDDAVQEVWRKEQIGYRRNR